jgi:hypothetical protein
MADSTYSLNPFSRHNPGTMGSRVAGANAMLHSTGMGRAFVGGSAEALGFHVGGFTDQPVGSFLGVSETLDEMGLSSDRFKSQARAVGKGTFGLAKKGRFVQAGKYLGKQGARAWAGVGAGKGALKFAGSTALKSLPLVGTALMAAHGYSQEGMWGAAKGVGESIMWGAGFRMATTALTNPLVLGAGLAAGIGFGTYALGEAGRAHADRLRKTEMIAEGAVDALGSVGAATGRQRSMMALNNTHLNGRMAMGNEGVLMHGDATTGRRGF